MDTHNKIIPTKIQDPHFNLLVKSLKSADSQRGRQPKLQHFAALCLKPGTATARAIWERVNYELAVEVCFFYVYFNQCTMYLECRYHEPRTYVGEELRQASRCVHAPKLLLC